MITIKHSKPATQKYKAKRLMVMFDLGKLEQQLQYVVDRSRGKTTITQHDVDVLTEALDVIRNSRRIGAEQ